MSQSRGFPVWWQGIPALPAGPEEQAYFALRRIWADQTINTLNGARSFYRWNTEDYLTPALWQTWAVFEDYAPLANFIRSIGAGVGTLSRARWAYACEEVPEIGSKIIPDIMLAYDDEHGSGVVAFEVKKPGTAAKAEDAGKLEQYCRLPSTRAFDRRHGCFLVSASAAAATRVSTGVKHPIATWEQLAAAQTGAALAMRVDEEAARLAAAWIRRLFARAGVGTANAPAASPASTYATVQGFELIRDLGLPSALERFLMGSECVEAAYRNEVPAAPLPWLRQEPTADQIRRPQYQTTVDRRVCRWNFTWSLHREHSYVAR